MLWSSITLILFYFYFYCFVNIDKKWFRERIFRFTWHRQINFRCHTHVCALLSGGGDLWTANPLGRASIWGIKWCSFFSMSLLCSPTPLLLLLPSYHCCFDCGYDEKIYTGIFPLFETGHHFTFPSESRIHTNGKDFPLNFTVV